MRRWIALAGLALIVGAGPPALAGGTSGSVLLPSVTPAIARELHNSGISAGPIAKVFSVPPGADGKTYTLTRTSGFGNLDAYFYSDAGGKVGNICNPIPNEPLDDLINQTTETGQICPGGQAVAWGIVILRWGANADFTLTW